LKELSVYNIIFVKKIQNLFMQVVIDLGTNTFQLLIADWDKSSSKIQIIENTSFAVSLGKGAMDSGLIQEEAKQRAWKALDYFFRLIQSHQISHSSIVAIGTSIIRNAKNGQEFLDEISKRYEIKTLKIDGQKEADYIFTGVRESMPNPWSETSLIMDIGGGSTEFILFRNREILMKNSYEIGGLKMLSMFHEQGEFSIDYKNQMYQYVLQQIPDLLEAIRMYQPKHLIGAAGAFETMNDLENLSKERKDLDFRNSFQLSVEIFYHHKRLLEQLTLKQREEFPGMKPFRAGILPAAMIEIDIILQHMHHPTLWFSTFSLKEGYFFESNRKTDIY
jgi:exopolyphosphatase/guanosine-5'-triphosphate,3'-diphosphate pyrophosphatase